MFNWFSSKKSKECPGPMTQGAKDFLSGKKDVLTSADINPEAAAILARFVKAMALKEDGMIEDAEILLIQSCEPASIYKGHYRELFKIWRQYNRDDIKAKKYQNVILRVNRMVILDEELIQEMLRYWSIQNKKKLPINYFNSSRNLLVSDAKALKKASEALDQKKDLSLAMKLIESFTKLK